MSRFAVMGIAALVLLGVLSLIFGGLLGSDPSTSLRPDMPRVDDVRLENSAVYGGMGTGACKDVTMEVRGNFVVWRLPDRRIPVVAVLVSDEVSWIIADYDLDGRIDHSETIPAGTGSIGDDFRHVEACRG